LKTRVNALMPGHRRFSLGPKGVDARHKAGHDDLLVQSVP
jgi:hypothetical protein